MQHKTYKPIAAAALLLLFVGAGVRAQQVQPVSAPRTLSYQGVLRSTGPAGNILAGIRLLTVTLYGDAYGTTKLWQSTMNTPVDSSGVFSCLLGTADNPLPPPAMMDRAIWLGVSIDGSPELRPLSEVTSSAYAINVADNAVTTDKLADSSVTNDKIAPGSVTPDKLNMAYVSTVSLNGNPITGIGSTLNLTGGNGVNLVWDEKLGTLGIYMADSGKGGMKVQQVVNNGFVQGTPDVCGTNSDGLVGQNTVSGGCDNAATAAGGYATIGGGQQNRATSTWATVGGGDTNVAISYYSTVGGGYRNSALSLYSTVAGGDSNTANAVYGFIGGGSGNSVGTNSSAIVGGDTNFIQGGANSGMESFIGGGEHNRILLGNGDGNGSEQAQSVIAGGLNNTITEGPSFIGGGEANNVAQEWAGIVAGHNNVDSADFGFIGAGKNNEIVDFDQFVPGQPDTIAGTSAIVAGEENVIRVGLDFIGGGFTNQIPSGNYSSVVGGRHNITSSNFDVIPGGDTNNISSDHGSIGGGRNNNIQGSLGAIAGGDANQIEPNTDHGSIGGGLHNIINQSMASISGGEGNLVAGDHGIIGGGRYNNVQGSLGAITGGDSNRILTSGLRSFVGSGYYNSINAVAGAIGGGDTNRIDTLAHHSVIGGGYYNIIQGPYGTIAGGDSNAIVPTEPPAKYNAIGGGLDGLIFGVSNAAISGGKGNTIGGAVGSLGNYSFIGAGHENLIHADYSVIGGGDTNTLFSSTYSVIGGGDTNTILTAPQSVIGGGERNLIKQPDTLAINVDHSFIGGGRANQIYSGFSTIAGGDSNLISLYASGTDTPFYSDHSFIGGGQKNEIRSEWNVIGGGQNNLIDVDTFGSKWSFIGGGLYNYDGPGGKYNVVVGGDDNLNNGGICFMGGGQGNQIYDNLQWSALTGGYWNFIGNHAKDRGANYASLVGGQQDTVAADFASMGGGRGNMITSNGQNADIPGGDSLTANSYAQTVIGYNNIQSPTMTKAQAVTGGAGGPMDNPLLIIGNGTTAATANQHDAFTVSYDGHSSAYDVNGSGGATLFVPFRPSFVGSTYEDNTIIAWGDIQAGAVTPPISPANANADFGVQSVTHSALGQYDVLLRVANPNGSAHALTAICVTVTAEDSGPTTTSCVFGTSTGLTGTNTFTIHLHDNHCNPVDNAFFFKVCGR